MKTKTQIEVNVHQRGKKIMVETELERLDGEKPNHYGMFRIINQSGDERLVWDKFSLAEIREAKKTFDKLVTEGMVPHIVDSKGKDTGKVMRKFDPHAEEIIFLPIPALAGG